MNKKYSGYNEDDTHFDEYHRSKGLMTNREFFTSNAKGGFYEGLEWDDENQEWVPNAETRQKEWEREERQKAEACPDGCGFSKSNCHCY